MDQHSVILILTLVIVILAIYLAVKYGSGEQFRRRDICDACNKGDWANCPAYLENSCL